MSGCPFEARGSSEDEVLAQATEHAKTAHNITEIPPGMMAMVKGAIREEA
jgi:predicted small metal-binding protein